MKFSQRKGYKPVAHVIQKEGMTDELRNSLWNALDGIRHAMIEEPDLDAADAKFFLLSYTSFINYLKSKI